MDPNDRSYDRKIEDQIKRMRPDELDRILREEDDDEIVFGAEWQDLRGADKAGGREDIATTIRREAPSGHEIQKGFEVLAKHKRLDYHVAALPDGRLALVHLAYRMTKSPDPLFDAEVFDTYPALLMGVGRWQRGD